MTRPVTGYLSSKGNFHETEAEANLDDASYILNTIAISEVRRLQDQVEPDGPLEQYLIEFIQQHEGEIYDFIIARRAVRKEDDISTAQPTGTEVAGSAVKTNKVDGARVRAKDNAQMVPDAVTKDEPPTAGSPSPAEEEPDIYNPTLADQ